MNIIDNETLEIEVNGKIHRFTFHPGDDQEEGATLVGVRYAGSPDIHQLAPSMHAENGAWDEANRFWAVGEYVSC